MFETNLSEKAEFINNIDLIYRINNFKPIDFEIDNLLFGHIQFIHSFANIKQKIIKFLYVANFIP